MSPLASSSLANAVLLPALRAFLRYSPTAHGKAFVWQRVVEPYFQWQPHAFTVKTIFGARLRGNTSDLIQNYLYYFGVWEPDLTDWALSRLRPGDTVVDIGANVGYFTLLAASRTGPAGAVVAIEASPRIHEHLVSNCELNRASHVRTVCVAAAAEPGRVNLYRGSEANLGESTIRVEAGFAFESEVDALPVTDILTGEEQRSVRLIKVDVEGAEWEVVAGLLPLLSSGRPDLDVLVEVDPDLVARQSRHVDELVDIFRGRGFSAHVLLNDYWSHSYLPPRTPRRFVPYDGSVPGEAHLLFTRATPES